MIKAHHILGLQALHNVNEAKLPNSVFQSQLSLLSLIPGLFGRFWLQLLAVPRLFKLEMGRHFALRFDFFNELKFLLNFEGAKFPLHLIFLIGLFPSLEILAQLLHLYGFGDHGFGFGFGGCLGEGRAAQFDSFSCFNR